MTSLCTESPPDHTPSLLKEQGLDAAEIKSFYRDMLIACDYGIVEPFHDVEISFPTTVADGTVAPCRMVIKRRGA